MKENEKQIALEELETITLFDEAGNEVDYMIDDEFEFQGKTYLVLCENDESEDALLYFIEECGEDDFVLKAVEDDDEFDEVSEYYNSLEIE